MLCLLEVAHKALEGNHVALGWVDEVSAEIACDEGYFGVRGVGNEAAPSQDEHVESFIGGFLVWPALLAGIFPVDVRLWFWVAVFQAACVKNVFDFFRICDR